MTHPIHPPAVKMGIPIPNSKLGMWLFLGTEIMFFTAFIGTYIVLYFGSPGWPTDTNVTHIKIWAGGTNTFVLILSSYFVVLAHEAMALRNFAKARRYLTWTFLLLTLLCACAFLGIKAYEYRGKWEHGILPGRIAETDDQATARARLHDSVAEWLSDEQERRWVEPRLAALLALEPMPPGSRDELFAAWRTFFERVAERGPAVLVFEDLQWADDGMLDFVGDLLDRSRNLPIFVLALTRPELNEHRPGWTSALRNLTQMSLEPLSPALMAEMVRGSWPRIS